MKFENEVDIERGIIEHHPRSVDKKEVGSQIAVVVAVKVDLVSAPKQRA